MRTTITSFALLALITSSAFAALKAPLPEFKNEKQLAEWRAEKASQLNTRTATQESSFYTGRPYLASSGSYAFKYRAYNPKIARWTSEDPSGFPDGANNSFYAPNPLSELDWSALRTITISGTKWRSGKEVQVRELIGSFPPSITYSWAPESHSWGAWSGGSDERVLSPSQSWASAETNTGAERQGATPDWQLIGIMRRERTTGQQQGWTRDLTVE